MNKRIFFPLFILIISLVFAGCANLQSTTTNTSEQIEIRLNPATKGLSNTLNLCDMSIAPFQYTPYYSETPTDTSYFHFGEPLTNLTDLIPITYDDISIIVPNTNPLTELTPSQIQAIFAGRITNWRDLGIFDAPISIYIFPYQSELQQAFQEHIMNGQPIGMNAKIESSIEVLLTQLQENPYGIGFLPTSSTVDTYNLTSFNTFATHSRVPILVSKGIKTPYADDRVLSCLQSESMQVILLQHYAAMIP